MKIRCPAILALSIAGLLLIAVSTLHGGAQQPKASGDPKTLAPIKVPDARAADLKKIEDRFTELQRQIAEVRQQWVITTQRAALEVGLTAAEVDAIDGPAQQPDGSYAWTPKPKPSPAPSASPPK